MYTSRTGLILGFHGTDKSIVNDILLGNKELEPSENSHDWLGNGIYFWDNSPSRAMEWAKTQSLNPLSKINEPAVIGAIIDLGYCLDLLDYKNSQLLIKGHRWLCQMVEDAKVSLPKNTGHNADLLNRKLDCAVIQSLHQMNKINSEKNFDSVRGVFWEGEPIYKDGFFMEKNHIQICIRDLNCIKGYFSPLGRIIN